MVKVEIKGLDSLRSRIQTLSGATKRGIERSLIEIVEETKGEAKSELASSIKHGTGELIGSIDDDLDINGDLFEATVFTDKKQGIFREFGTGRVGFESEKLLPPNINPSYRMDPWIFPVSSVSADLTALYNMKRIMWQGEEFYVTSGQKARPFLYPAFLSVQERADEIVSENISDEIRKALKR